MPIIDTLEKFNALPRHQYFYPQDIEMLEPYIVYYIRCDDLTGQLVPLEDEAEPDKVNWYFRMWEVQFSRNPMPEFCGTFMRMLSENRLQLINRGNADDLKLAGWDLERRLESIEHAHMIPVTLYS
jgi:hypothetical protein